MSNRVKRRSPAKAHATLDWSTTPIPHPMHHQKSTMKHTTTTTAKPKAKIETGNRRCPKRLTSGGQNGYYSRCSCSIGASRPKSINAQQGQLKRNQHQQQQHLQQYAYISQPTPLDSYYNTTSYMEQFGQPASSPYYFSNSNMSYVLPQQQQQQQPQQQQQQQQQPQSLYQTRFATVCPVPKALQKIAPNTVPRHMMQNTQQNQARREANDANMKYPQPLKRSDDIEASSPKSGAGVASMGQILNRIDSVSSFKDSQGCYIRDSSQDILEYKQRHDDALVKPKRVSVLDSTTTLTPRSVGGVAKKKKKAFKDRLKSSVMKHTARLRHSVRSLIVHTAHPLTSPSKLQMLKQPKKNKTIPAENSATTAHTWTRSYPTSKVTTNTDVAIKRRYPEKWIDDTHLKIFKGQGIDVSSERSLKYRKHKIKYENKVRRDPKSLYPTCSSNDNW